VILYAGGFATRDAYNERIMSETQVSRRSIALVGLSGSGKSSVGRMLHARLGLPLLDTDAIVVQQAGCEIAQIFAEHGEPYFRDMETAALEQALGQLPAIIATGGGIVLREHNRELLRQNTLVVWLDASTETIVARLSAHDEQRPLLQGDMAEMAERVSKQRESRAAIYGALAELHIVTDQLSLDQICDLIIAQC
jgi:shikimate kinase